MVSHSVSTVTKQRAMNSGAQFTFSFVLRLGYQPIEWCHPQLPWVFLSQLAKSRNTPFPEVCLLCNSRCYQAEGKYEPLQGSGGPRSILVSCFYNFITCFITSTSWFTKLGMSSVSWCWGLWKSYSAFHEYLPFREEYMKVQERFLSMFQITTGALFTAASIHHVTHPFINCGAPSELPMPPYPLENMTKLPIWLSHWTILSFQCEP